MSSGRPSDSFTDPRTREAQNSEQPLHRRPAFQIVRKLLQFHQRFAEPAKEAPLLWSLLDDPQPSVRRIAAAIPRGNHRLADGPVERAMRRLVADPALAVRQQANNTFRQLFRAAPRVVRTRVTGAWATAPEVRVRVAIAVALAEHSDHPGGGTAIEHLTRDPSPVVQQHAFMTSLRGGEMTPHRAQSSI